MLAAKLKNMCLFSDKDKNHPASRYEQFFATCSMFQSHMHGKSLSTISHIMLRCLTFICSESYFLSSFVTFLYQNLNPFILYFLLLAICAGAGVPAYPGATRGHSEPLPPEDRHHRHRHHHRGRGLTSSAAAAPRTGSRGPERGCGGWAEAGAGGSGV